MRVERRYIMEKRLIDMVLEFYKELSVIIRN